jgi:hypothetical protein
MKILSIVGKVINIGFTLYMCYWLIETIKLTISDPTRASIFMSLIFTIVILGNIIIFIQEF